VVLACVECIRVNLALSLSAHCQSIYAKMGWITACGWQGLQQGNELLLKVGTQTQIHSTVKHRERVCLVRYMPHDTQQTQ
jgi:hypothetical protein